MLNELSGLSSRSELKMARTNVAELLAGTLEMMSEKLQERKVDITYDRQNTDLFIMADQERLRQVFLNLIINAMDAMPEGGSLIVTAGYAAAKDTHNPKHIEARIRDTGGGMSGEAIGKIFEPFYTTHKDGLGLGLTITRNIVEQHGGSITVESAPKAGTTFIITLPIEIPLSTSIRC
jgi:signal transduction histidine kinase